MAVGGNVGDGWLWVKKNEGILRTLVHGNWDA